MPDSFIHFNRRTVRRRLPATLETPWYAEAQEATGGFDRPAYHVTRATGGAAARVKPGDTIWLVGQLYMGKRKLPPALDARIEVLSVDSRRNEPGFRYAASPASRWFPLVDLRPVLLGLQSRDAMGNLSPLLADPDRPVGFSLRRMRQLVDDEPFRRWEEAMDSRDHHFISYRLKDGTAAAFETAHDLCRRNVPFFWDRWSMPRRLVERRELVEDAYLNRMIEQHIRRAETVLGVESPLYFEAGCYATRERELAQSLHKYRSVNVT